MIKCLVKECNANVNGESSASFGHVNRSTKSTVAVNVSPLHSLFRKSVL